MQANIDEQPIGGGKNPSENQANEEYTTSANQADNSGPLEERLVSKNWSARANAFEELTNAFKIQDNPNDIIFKDHGSMWKKYLSDTNPGALEKCLEALHFYIDKGHKKLVGESQNDIIKMIIEKCLLHAKPSIKQKSLECFLFLFEVSELFEESNETILELLNSKNIKVNLSLTFYQISTSAVLALWNWVGNYGVKKVKVKPFLPVAEGLANSSNPQMRIEVMNFYKECYKWLGDGLKPLIQNLKKQQLDDLDKAFEEIKGLPKNLRLTRTDKEKAKDDALDGILKKEEEEKQMEIDAYDLAEEVDLLKKYGQEFEDKVAEMKQWKEKKDMLDQLVIDSSVPKLKNGDYMGLVKMVKKLINDTNPAVCQAAVKVCGSLSNGLKQNFEPYVKELMATLIQKFKEKRPGFAEDIFQALDNFLVSQNLEQMLQEVLVGVNDKAPTVKKNSILFIEKAAQKTFIDVLQRCASEIMNALLKQSEDSNAEIRDAALSAIGIMKGRLGESAMSKYISDLNPQKLSKVTESAQQVQPSKYDRPEKVEKKPAPAPQGGGAKKAPPKKKTMPSKEENKIIEEEEKPLPNKNTQAFDEQPIGGGNGGGSEFDEKPLGGGGGGGYNLDNLDESAFGGGAMNFENKPKRAPPARLANKKKEEKKVEEDVEMKDEEIKEIKKASPKKKSPVKPKETPEVEDFAITSNQPQNIVEQSIGGEKPEDNNGLDERPIERSNGFDERPLGGGSGFDEKPLGGIKNGGYNLDNLDESAFGGGPMNIENKPKKAPPARLAKKQEEEKKDSFDVDMKDEEVKKPTAKPAPKKETPAKNAKPAGKAAAAGKAQGGDDDDAGAGMSKEEADEKVSSVFSAETVTKCEESKWQDKKEGFEELGQAFPETSQDAVLIEAIARFVKSRMKEWKESNINLIKETINLFLAITKTSDKVNKKAVTVIMPFLSDKIGDVKHCALVSELIMLLAEQVTPKFMALQVIKYGLKAKAPNVIKESQNILTTMIDEFGIALLPVKEMIDFAINGAAHTNPQVRTSSMALFAMLYKHVGEQVKNFMKDIKESTMKLIEEEFAKVVPLKKGEAKSKRQLKGAEALAEAGAAVGGGGGLDALPREDISKHITAKLLPMFKHQDWKVRKEASDKVEEILKAANMRIKPDGLNELLDNVKQRMADPNKAVLKCYITLNGALAEALGPGAKQFQKKILVPMLNNLTDKQTLVRQDVVAAMNKWGEHVGPEVIINNVVPLLIQENPELRDEALKWILKNKDSLKQCDTKEFPKALVSITTDKVPSIRAMAEQVITEVMPITGYPAFQAVLTDLKPAIQSSVKTILERVKNNLGSSLNSTQQPVPVQQQMNTSNPNPRPQTAKQGGKPDSNNNSLKDQQTPAAAPKLKTLAQQKVEERKAEEPTPSNPSKLAESLKKKSGLAAQPNQARQRSQSRENQQKGKFGTTIASASEPKVEELTINGGIREKEKRQEIDRKNKWQLDVDIKSDQIDKLKNVSLHILGQSFQSKMFSNDFKQHIECINAFQHLMNQDLEQLSLIFDIIFKWSFVKLADSKNTTFAVNIFDFYGALLAILEENQYMLWDFEAAILIPMLYEKTGLNNAVLKDKVKMLVKMVYNLFDKHKCYQFMVSYGIGSKNLRAVSECLDEFAEFIKKYGIDYTNEKEIKVVAKMADHADKSIRENALKAMSELYKLLGDDIWRAIGEVTVKVQGLLEQRFKKLAPQEQIEAEQQQVTRNTEQPAKTQQNFGLKKATQIDQRKGNATPRSGLHFGKPLGQGQNIQSQSNLSRSINQFNNSQGESSATPMKTVLKKGGSTQEATQIQGSMLKKPIPATTRPTYNQGSQERAKDHQMSNISQNKIPITTPPQQQQYQNIRSSNQQVFDDDDEDLRIFTNEENFGDPEIDKQQDEITKNIHQLKYGDLSKRVDSLVALNEMISNIEINKVALVKTANELVNAFTHVLIDIFDKPVEEIPLRFAKYFITIVHKACSCKEIMKDVREDRILDLSEQLLTRLLIENLEKVGDNKEGELILKNLNSSMLRLLENCNHTYIFCVLFNLLRKYKDFNRLPKLPGLIIKCLLKLSKILEKLIDKLDIEKILLAIHEYLIVINHDNKTQNDEMGIRIVKTVTNELVKLKRDSIWEAYRVIQCHSQQDNHIYRWINIILKSLQSQSGASTGGQTSATSGNLEIEIKQIIEELRNPDQFEIAIPKLHKFLEQHPQIDLNDYIQECSKTFQTFIRQNLEKHQKEQVAQTKLPQMLDSMKSTNNSDNSHTYGQQKEEEKQGGNIGGNKINEYQNKLSSIKQRFNAKPQKAETTTNKDSQAQNLYSSFSAMNSSLSKKWDQIQKSSATKRDGGGTGTGSHMNNTIGGFGQVENKIGKGNSSTNLNQSQGANSNDNNSSGATNQDLNKRLAEMKAKLQALKKK